MTRPLALVWSPGWYTDVVLGEGQAHALRILRAVQRRHPGRTWYSAPPLRGFGRSPGTAHRLIHSLASRGVVALDTVLGCQGVVRFTFGVVRWRWEPPRRAQLARMGALALLRDSPPNPPATLQPPEAAPPERPRTPETAGGGVHVHSGFADRLARAGFQPWWGK
jgi:hypothetical protein